ncbi:MAG: PRC-barrel domain-containing protein [Thermoanaerobaculia bacterium]|nr:PRC-barrel domain-containing protein [Thermoanaerobaculia bacterium]
MQHTATHVLSATTLIGDDVKNTTGDTLGKVEEIMLDLGSGSIRYAVMSSGGFLGIGDHYFAVPWRALQVDTADHCLILDVSPEKLKGAPGFDKDDWPDFADPTFGKTVYTYYGQPTYW